MGGFQQERVPGGKEVQEVVLDRFAVGVPADLGTARRLGGGDHVLLAPGAHGGRSETCAVRITELEDLGLEGVRCTVVTDQETYPLTP